MEVPGQGPSPPSSSAISTQPLQNLTVTSNNQSSSVRQVDPNNPDDPLAAIMNQTIFGGRYVTNIRVENEKQNKKLLSKKLLEFTNFDPKMGLTAQDLILDHFCFIIQILETE